MWIGNQLYSNKKKTFHDWVKLAQIEYFIKSTYRQGAGVVGKQEEAR